LAFKRLKKISKSKPEIDYNIACLYARQGNIEKSIYWLKQAVQSGYSRWDSIESDKDLEVIRNTPEFLNLRRMKVF